MTTDTQTGEVTNPEERQRLRKQAEQQVQENRRERREAGTLKQRIESTLASETVSLPVGGEAIEFQTFDRETSEWAALLQERVRRLEGENFEQEFRQEVDRIYHTLGRHAEPDWMTATWWQDQIPISRAIQYLTSINAEAEITEEDIKNSQSRTSGSGSSR